MYLKYFVNYKTKKSSLIKINSIEGDSYYEEVRSHIDNGLRQFIISEEVMIELIVYFISVKKFVVNSIELRDTLINEKIGHIVEAAKVDSSYNSLLILELCKNKNVELDKVSFESELGEISFNSIGKVIVNGDNKLIEYAEEINFLIENWLFKYS